MPLKRMVLQIGMGTDIRGADSTKAAVRAVRDALWHNTLGLAQALKQPPEAMHVDITIGVPNPASVDTSAVLAVLPYGRGSVAVVDGGLKIENDARTDATAEPRITALVILGRLVERCPKQFGPPQQSIVQRRLKILRRQAAKRVIEGAASMANIAPPATALEPPDDVRSEGRSAPRSPRTETGSGNIAS